MKKIIPYLLFIAAYTTSSVLLANQCLDGSEITVTSANPLTFSVPAKWRIADKPNVADPKLTLDGVRIEFYSVSTLPGRGIGSVASRETKVKISKCMYVLHSGASSSFVFSVEPMPEEITTAGALRKDSWTYAAYNPYGIEEFRCFAHYPNICSW